MTADRHCARSRAIHPEGSVSGRRRFVARALQKCAAAAGLGSELKSVLGDDPRFIIAPLPTLSNSRNGWAVGLAVKKDADELAAALQGAVDGLIADKRMQQIFNKGSVSWRAA
jgi:ABC-type amino acid transport substrate-binding protein